MPLDETDPILQKTIQYSNIALLLALYYTLCICADELSILLIKNQTSPQKMVCHFGETKIYCFLVDHK